MDTCSPCMLSQVAYIHVYGHVPISGCIHTCIWTCTYLRLHTYLDMYLSQAAYTFLCPHKRYKCRQFCENRVCNSVSHIRRVHRRESIVFPRGADVSTAVSPEGE